MFITKDQSIDILTDVTKIISEELLEKHDFLTKLLLDDDWSFVIKSHSLIESLATELIINTIDEKELKKIIERMPLHGNDVSKMKIITTYNILTKEEKDFITNLTQIRNSIVHKYENINFSFEIYLKGLDKNQKRKWRDNHTWDSMSEEVKVIINKTIYLNPKIAVWLTLSILVSNSLLKISTIKSKKITNETSEKNSKIIVEDFLSKQSNF